MRRNVRPKTSPYEAKGFRLKVRRARRKVFRLKVRRTLRRFSPETSPCEAKDVFALNFAVRSERRFRPKVRRARRMIFARKFALIQHRSYP